MAPSKNDSLTQKEFEMVEDLMSQLENVTIDKEISEERAEQLQNELDAQKLRIQELETDLELARAEMEAVMEGNDNVVNNYQVKQLEEQNEKLREALVKMRDMMAEASAEAEILTRDRDECQTECAKLRQKLLETEEMARLFKEQVDAGQESVRMIEVLTEKNLDLEDKLKKTEEENKHLEEMRVMDEEMVETQKEIERSLREELDKAFLNQLISTFDTRAAEYDEMISKFQSKVERLNESLKIYQEKENIPIAQQYEDKLSELHESRSRLRTDLTRALKEKERAITERDALQSDLEQALFKSQQSDDALKAFMIQVESAQNAMETIAKQESEIVELKKMIVMKNDDIGSLKVRIAVNEKILEELGKIDRTKMEQLQQKHDKLKTELEDKERMFKQTEEQLQHELENKKAELEELRKVKNRENNVIMAHLQGVSTITESDYIELLKGYQSAHKKIRKLESEVSNRMMSEMPSLKLASTIDGPLTFRFADKSQADVELEKMVKESEELLLESGSYLIEPVYSKQKLVFHNRVAQFTQRLEQLKFRFQRFWTQNYPAEEPPRILTKLSKIGATQKPKSPEARPDRCQQILTKWKRIIEENRNSC